MTWYYVGCGFIGLATGILVGGSASPVVQVVLPILFASLGGAAGFLSVLKSDEGTADPRFAVAGKAAVCLVAPFLVASVYSALIRTNTPISALVPAIESVEPEAAIEESAQARLGPDATVRILLLEQDLKRLDIPERTRSLLVSSIEKNDIGLLNYIVAHRSEIRARVENVLTAATALNPEGDNGYLTSLSLYLDGYLQVSAGKAGDPGGAELAVLERLEEHMTSDDALYSSETKALIVKSSLSESYWSLLDVLRNRPKSNFIDEDLLSEIRDRTRTKKTEDLNSSNVPYFAVTTGPLGGAS